MLIDDFTIEQYGTKRVRLAWEGTVGKVVYIFVNAHLHAGPLDFDGIDREYIVEVPTVFRVEIHELSEGESSNRISDPLERHPLLKWTPVSGAKKYRIYRNPVPGGDESRLEDVPHDEGLTVMEHQITKDQRQDDAQWNFYRIEARNQFGEESGPGDPFSFWIPGLPAIPTGIAAVEDGGNLKVTLSA